MRTTVGLRFLYTSMNYTKEPIDFPSQIDLLKSNGMNVAEDTIATLSLSSISYFRLASYWHHLQDKTTNQFKASTDFSEVLWLYSFDKELRNIIFMAIQDIEIAFRTRLSHFASMKYGAFWYLNPDLFKDLTIHNICHQKLQDELKRSHEEFIQEHFDKYNTLEHLPSWKIFEIASFGTLSKIFSNIADVELKKEISHSFKLPSYPFLENWMKCVVVLRNCCAHHARLWNRRFSIIPKFPKHLPGKWIDSPIKRPEKIYGQLCCLAYLEQSIYPNTGFSKKIQALLAQCSDTHLKGMGAFSGWHTAPIWQEIT